MLNLPSPSFRLSLLFALISSGLVLGGCGFPTSLTEEIIDEWEGLEDDWDGLSDSFDDVVDDLTGDGEGCETSFDFNLIMEQTSQACADCQIWFWGMGVPEQRPRLVVSYTDSDGAHTATFQDGPLGTDGPLWSTRILAEAPWWGPGSCVGDVSCASDYLHHFEARGDLDGAPLWHGLLFADLRSIPCEASITEARLHLHINEDEGLANADHSSVVSLYRGTKVWSPGMVNGQRYGNSPETGDELWDTPGGDFGEFVRDLEAERDFWARGFNKANPAAWFDFTDHVVQLQSERFGGEGLLPDGDEEDGSSPDGSGDDSPGGSGGGSPGCSGSGSPGCSGSGSPGGSDGGSPGGTPSGDPTGELTGDDVIWLENMDVTDWPVTSSLNSVTFVGGQISLDYDKRDEWPSTYVSGVEVVANAWVIAEHEGQWYGKTWEWMRPGQHSKSRSSVNGAHTGAWPFAPGESFLPTPGVTYYFMVSTPARFGSIMTIAERSNLVPIVWN